MQLYNQDFFLKRGCNEMECASTKAYGLNINDFLREEFLDKLGCEFGDKDVDVVTLQIALSADIAMNTH